MFEFTNNQKAAIYFHIFGGCDDKAVLFQIAEGEKRYNELTDKSKGVTTSRWWNSAKIIELRKEIQTIKERQETETERKILQRLETERTKGAKDQNFNGSTNFLNRDEFLQFLNERANEVKDDRQLTDTLKMISDNLRYKDSDKEGENEQIKAYLPLQCYSCELKKRCEACKFEVCPVETL